MSSAETRSVSSTGGEKGVKAEKHNLIPVGPLSELALHYGRGALKYAPHQWRAGYEWSKSYDAAQRHLLAFWGGQEWDVCPDDRVGCQDVTATGESFERVLTPNGWTCYNHTGSTHLACAAWNVFALMEFFQTHPEFDDRYKPAPDPDEEIDTAPQMGIFERFKQSVREEMNRGIVHGDPAPSDPSNPCDNPRCVICFPRGK